MEFWKRQTKRLGHTWNVLDYQRDEEKPSSNYCLHATKLVHNPVTQRPEPHFSKYTRIYRRAIGVIVLIAFIFISLTLHSIVIVLRLSMHHVMFLSEGLRYVNTKQLGRCLFSYKCLIFQDRSQPWFQI